MSMPNEALQKVFQEISQKKAFAEQQLLIVRQQKVARTREGRMLQLTSSEVSSLPPDTKVYEGVGKMYALNPTRDREAKRFVYTPIPDVQKRLKAESEALTKEMSNLDKKEDYLEKTYTNSKNSLEQVLKGAS